MATLDDLQTSGSLQGTDKILYRQSGTDYAATLDTLRKFAIMQLVDGSVSAAKAKSADTFGKINAGDAITPIYFNNGIPTGCVKPFAICRTAAGEPIKTAVIDGFRLTPGSIICLEIQAGNTANDLAKITAKTETERILKLNVSNTGAYEIRMQNTNTHGYKGCFTAGGIYEFIFDGTYWICTNGNISAVNQAENASYIKYTNGLITQWGVTKNHDLNTPIYYPIAFTAIPRLICGQHSGVYSEVSVPHYTAGWVVEKNRFFVLGKYKSSYPNGYVDWFAIGF